MYPYTFPNYQPNYQQMYQPQPQPQPPQIPNPQPVDDRIFVANASAADAYLVAPNSFVRLWDSSKPVFYEKQADASGRQFPLVVYEYKKQETKQDLSGSNSDIEERLKAIEAKLKALEEGKANDEP